MNDNYDDNFEQSVIFSFSEDNTTTIKEQTFPDGVTWPVILESFLNFLEASGYVGVKNKVRLEANPFVESDWTLGTYDPDMEMKAHW